MNFLKKGASSVKNFFSNLRNKFRNPAGLPTNPMRRRAVYASLILFAAILLVFVFVTRNDGLFTGNAVKQEQTVEEIKTLISDNSEKIDALETNLAPKVDELLQKNEEIRAKNDEISGFQGQIAGFQTTIDGYAKKEQELSAKISSLESQRDKLEVETDALYTALESSARTICCSLSQMKNGAIINWNINDGGVVCSGQYDLNCATGESNFDGDSEDSDETNSSE